MTRSNLASVSAATVFLLNLLFIGSAAAALVLGVKAHGSLNALSKNTFEECTVPAFIAEKLREGDGDGTIYTGDFGGSSALFIESSFDGILFTDIIYGYDGQLFELFCEKDAPFSRENGLPLTATGAVTFSEPKTGLIHVIITCSDGGTTVLDIFLRSGGEV